MISIAILIATGATWTGAFFALPVWMSPASRALWAAIVTTIVAAIAVMWRWRKVSGLWRAWFAVLFAAATAAAWSITVAIRRLP